MHRSVRHDRPDAAARSTRCWPASDLLVVGAPHADVPRPRRRHAGRRHLEPARGREPRVTSSPSGVGRHPRLQRGRGDRARASTGMVEAVTLPCEVLVVVDTADDTTVAPSPRSWRGTDPRLRTLVNTYGRGPANAIRYGIDHARAPVVVVTMADGSDDPRRSTSSPARRARRGRRRGLALHAAVASRSAARPSRACCRGWPGSRCYWFGPGRHPRRDQLVQGVLDASSCATVGIDSRQRLRDRASSWWPRPAGSGCRSPRSRRSGSTASIGRLELQGRRVDPRGTSQWYRFAFGPGSPLDAVGASRETTPDTTREPAA